MKASQLFEHTAYGPDTLKVLFQAFDEAWKKIASSVGDDAQAIEKNASRARVNCALARDR